MIIRAFFGILVALLLIPHEPDVGMGRPGAYGLHAPLVLQRLMSRIRITIDAPSAAPENIKRKTAAVSVWTIKVKISN